MTTGPAPACSRALVLGGGGVTGIAWQVGVLAGLRAAGVDLSDADAVLAPPQGRSSARPWRPGATWSSCSPLSSSLTRASCPPPPRRR